jgi:hypothetical protein
MARKPKFTQRESLGLRVSPELKRWLDEAAAQSGRSQSTEAAVRLERSFTGQSHLLPDAVALAYGEQLGGLLLILGHAMHGAALMTFLRNPGHRPDGDWTADPEAYREAVHAAVALLELAWPAGGQSRNSTEAGFFMAEHAVRLLHMRPEGGRPTLALDLLRLLGPIADRMIDELPKWEERRRKFKAQTGPHSGLPGPLRIAAAVIDASKELTKLTKLADHPHEIEAFIEVLTRHLKDFLVPGWEHHDATAQADPSALPSRNKAGTSG